MLCFGINSNESLTSNKHEEHEQQDAVEGVAFAAPERGKDVVELDGDGTEGQEPANQHLRRRRVVQRRWGNLSARVLRPAWCIKGPFGYHHL